MDACITRLSIAGPLSEVQVLTGQHSLTGCVVGIHTLPSSGKRTTMEDDQQSEVVGIYQNILIQLHHLLLVTTEEVDLDTTDPGFLHPCHLLSAHQVVVHLT